VSQSGNTLRQLTIMNLALADMTASRCLDARALRTYW
jgi:hypothetical protein